MKSYFSSGEKLLFVSVATGIEFAQDAAVATGLYVVEPLAVVANAAAGARLHEF